MIYSNSTIDDAFVGINSFDKDYITEVVNEVLQKLNSGEVRSAFLDENGLVVVNESVKKAILLKFKLSSNKLIQVSGDITFFDKVDMRYRDYSEDHFLQDKIRVVPGAFVRNGSYVGENCILMPCFINIGARIDSGTMIDSGVTVGSCCQIGKNCHISSNVVLAGVLEPMQATPVIISDDCFIGAGCVIAEGVVVEQNCVIASGVHITGSTKIVDRNTGEVFYGRIPKNSVVILGSLNENGSSVSLSAAIIVKKIDEQTRKKTSINEILRF